MTADTPAGMDEAAIDPESDEVWAFAKTIMAHMVDETYGNASGYVLRDDPRNLALSLMRSGYRKPDAARAEVESARAVLARVTCTVCDELLMPFEESLLDESVETADRWAHRDCMEAGE